VGGQHFHNPHSVSLLLNTYTNKYILYIYPGPHRSITHGQTQPLHPQQLRFLSTKQKKFDIFHRSTVIGDNGCVCMGVDVLLTFPPVLPKTVRPLYYPN
jgi:hypothetical protein